MELDVPGSGRSRVDIMVNDSGVGGDQQQERRRRPGSLRANELSYWDVMLKRSGGNDEDHHRGGTPSSISTRLAGDLQELPGGWKLHVVEVTGVSRGQHPDRNEVLQRHGWAGLASGAVW